MGQVWSCRMGKTIGKWRFNGILWDFIGDTLWKINIDPENHNLLVERNLQTPICQGLC